MTLLRSAAVFVDGLLTRKQANGAREDGTKWVFAFLSPD